MIMSGEHFAGACHRLGALVPHPTGKEKAKFHAARGGPCSHLAIQGPEGIRLRVLQHVSKHGTALLLLSQASVKIKPM